jgi:hypothetical protein
MSSSFEMKMLLEKSGFRVHNKRADCAHCEGGSRLTVSFTEDFAYCHRCKWKANKFTLARHIGLLSDKSEAASTFREEARQRASVQVEIKHFDAWRDAKIRQVSNKYRLLSRTALCATEVLTKFPDCEAAWSALARFYHSEARLSAAFDWLVFAKASAWLELDSTPSEIFDAWRNNAA